MAEKISREELVQLYDIEVTFLQELRTHGLLQSVWEQEREFFFYEELPLLEKFIRWHYDLEVNVPGLQVIQHLLGLMEELQQKNRLLQNLDLLQVRRYDLDLE